MDFKIKTIIRDKERHYIMMKGDPPEARQQKQEELQSCSLWNKNHIHSKIDTMKRQRAMYQMKKPDKTPEKQLNEVEIGNLPEKEFMQKVEAVKEKLPIGEIIQITRKNKRKSHYHKNKDRKAKPETESRSTVACGQEWGTDYKGV